MLSIDQETDHHDKDAELWQALKEGDRHALAQLYSLHIQELLSYGYRITPNRALIKDSIQDLFLHLWHHRSTIGNTTSVKFYLYRSLRNRIIRNLEYKHLEITGQEDFLERTLTELPLEANWIEEDAYREQVTRLQQAIRKLPKRQQEAIQLRYFHAFSPAEVAQIMDINYQSVRNLLHQAIEQLRHSSYCWRF